MKRFHVHVAVQDLEKSVRFYSTLFATKPTVLKPDYAKWMLEDPRVNFAISQRGGAAAGVEHLGIQAEDEDELADVFVRLSRAEGQVIEEKATTCCYAQSDKQWITDPQGVAWETFFTFGEATVYGKSRPSEQTTAAAEAPCCTPKATASCGCGPAPAAV